MSVRPAVSPSRSFVKPRPRVAPVALVGPAALLATLLLAAPAARADHPVAGVGGGGAGPINTVSADTLPEGLWSLSMRLELIDLQTFSNAELAQFAADDVDAHSADRLVVPSLGVAYGVTDDLTVGARLPFVSMQDVREPSMDGGTPGSAALGDSEGLGDVTLFAEQRLAHEDEDGPAWALLAGLKLPTGADREHTDEGGLFQAEHQPGSGSVDPLLGVAVTRHWGRHSVSANALYTLVTQGSQRTDLGDVLQVNVGWAYQLGGEEPHVHADGTVHEHHHDDGTTWDLVLELNGVRRARQAMDGASDENSGGTRLFLAPGVRCNAGGRWSAFASVGVPLAEHVHGAEHETDAQAVGGLGFAF